MNVSQWWWWWTKIGVDEENNETEYITFRCIVGALLLDCTQYSTSWML